MLRKLLLFLLILFPFIFPKIVSAQVAGFDNSSQVRSSYSPADKNPKQIVVPPATAIYLDPGTFNTNTQIIVSKGIWTNMKNLIATGQSPIAAYMIQAYDNSGVQIFPTKPIRVQVYNNYSGTNTYVYQLNTSGSVDQGKTQTHNGQVRADINVTQDDPGFIVAINKNISEDEQIIIPTGSTAPIASQSKAAFDIGQYGYAIALVVLIGILVILLYSLKKKLG